MYDRILIRFGDLTLKGKNQGDFIRQLYKMLDEKLQGLPITIEKKHDHAYVLLNGYDYNEVIERLNLVAGIYSYSLVKKIKRDLDILKEESLNYINELVKGPTTFKVEAKRADKTFNLTSPEVSKIISAHILKNNKLVTADLHKPKLELRIEIRSDGIYLFNSQIRGLGGYPTGIAGKGLLMLSGGIDSPVAGFLAMKQGIKIECIHFESTPLTSIESANKVVDLVKIMAKYAPGNKILLHMVPFKNIHMQLLEKVPESYNITIMRRMMYRIASKVAANNKDLVLINGESVGQVASQTLQSMATINEVTNMPVIRPLATYDKLDIIALSRKIKAFDISIKPFEDCCTVYVPKAPSTAPRAYKARHFEEAFPYEEYVDEAVKNTKSLWINTFSDLDLSMYGLEVGEAIDEYHKAKQEGNN